MQANPKTKNPRVAGGLALVTGPLGFLYIGWRYTLAATVVFLSIIMVFALLPVPFWLKYVNLPLFAFMAHRICQKLNRLVDRELHRDALASNTLPVAVFAMTSMLPLLAGVHSAFMGGDVGRGLFMLLLVTPIFVAVIFVGFALIATLIVTCPQVWYHFLC